MIFLINVSLILAQEKVEISDLKQDFDTNYIRSYSDRLTIKPYGVIKTHNMRLEQQDKDIEVRYKPNENFSLGFGFNYKWLGLGFAFKVISESGEK